MNKVLLIILASVFLISGCVGQTSETVQTGEVENIGQDALEIRPDDPSPGQEEIEPEMNWRDFELTEVETGDMFKISDFEGKSVILESMAVWCPTCTRQQREIGELVASGDDSIHISLDTDPNEDEAILLTHKVNNGFTWNYIVAPRGMVQSLVDEFGLTVINAPLAPIILVCPDQSARLLKNGVKNSDKLAEEIAAGC